MGFRVTVEVPLFLTYFSFMLTDSINTNLMIYRTCYILLDFDKHNCSLLGNIYDNMTKELEQAVQPKADVIVMVKTVVDSVSAGVLCLFVGAWSDRFGRKPILIVNLVGYTLMNLVMVVFSAVENASPWFMITCSIPVILTGGWASLLTILLAYLTDVTSESERGFRMGIFEATLGAAVLTGSASSSYVFNATSYVIVYGIAAAICLSVLIYTWYWLPESLEVRESTGRIKGFFQIQNISGMVRTTFRTRPRHNRTIILLTMFVLALFYVVTAGDVSVLFLFMREKFYWTLKQYTWYSSVNSTMWIASTFLMVYVVHHKLHVKETKVMLFGFMSLVAGALTLGLARVDWLIYVATAVRIPSGGLGSMSRSLLSKLVNDDEAGKLFAVFSVIQNILVLIGSPVYTTLYNSTIHTNPSIFNFLTASAHAVSTLCILIVLEMQRRDGDSYLILQAENFEETEEVFTNYEQNDLKVNS